MVVFGKNWEDFNSHPGNPRGYLKCTSTAGVPRPIAPLPPYPHPDTPWFTMREYKFCGVTAKPGVSMSYIRTVEYWHFWANLFMNSNIEETTLMYVLQENIALHPMSLPYFLSKK